MGNADFDNETDSGVQDISYILVNSGYLTGVISGDYILAELPNLEAYNYFKAELKGWLKIQN